MGLRATAAFSQHVSGLQQAGTVPQALTFFCLTLMLPYITNQPFVGAPHVGPCDVSSWLESVPVSLAGAIPLRWPVSSVVLPRQRCWPPCSADRELPAGVPSCQAPLQSLSILWEGALKLRKHQLLIILLFVSLLCMESPSPTLLSGLSMLPSLFILTPRGHSVGLIPVPVDTSPSSSEHALASWHQGSQVHCRVPL